MMFFTARSPGVAEPNAGGAIGFATSPDLYDWTLQPPVYAGGTFGQMEVPQVFEAGGRWYCLFCTDGSHYSEGLCAPPIPATPVQGTHYLVADDPRGPWEVAPGPFLDGDPAVNRYAARIVETDDGPEAARLPAQSRRRRLRRRDHRPGAGDHRRRTAG